MTLDFSALRIGSLARKSTKDKEDQQVLSIPSQHEENGKSAQRVGATIAKIFTEERSAKAPGRPVFDELTADIEAGVIDAIVCWRLNRLARNPIDGGKIMWLLQKGILKAIITSEKVYLPSDNVIQMAVEFGMSTQYSIDLGKDVKRGMLAKVKAGWKPGIAPIGYRSDYGGVKGEKVIHKDPERFPIIRRCWEHLLTGAYTVEEIHQLAIKEWGLTIQHGRRGTPRPYGRTSMYALFTEPFYYGEFEWNGQTWQGAHEPMVTRAEFDKAQEILGAKGKPRIANFSHPYPGLIRCSCCKASIIYECKRKTEKRSGVLRTYCYLRCSKRKKNVRCEEPTRLLPKELEKQVYAEVAKIRMPRAFTEWALEELQLSQKDRAKLREQDRDGDGLPDDV
ncbi:MAG: recombinase family protein, partial [Patescibacteria group bacterium]